MKKGKFERSISSRKRSEIISAPILLIIFNRPDLTRALIDLMRPLRPKFVFVTADGPRADHPNDIQNCAETRREIEKIDWSCKVQRRFLRKNSGCKRAVSSGISWFFEQVPEGIILEDDIQPTPEFFYYCQELLAMYREDQRIGMISGCNLSSDENAMEASYDFMQYFHIWGWATWRRAWRGYDPEILDWPKLKNSEFLAGLFPTRQEAEYWEKHWDETYEGKINTWDYQWALHNYLQSRFAIAPAINLVQNVGFREDATHTTSGESPLPETPKTPFLPLRHPKYLRRNWILESASRASFGSFQPHDDFPIRSYRKLRRLIGNLKRWLLS